MKKNKSELLKFGERLRTTRREKGFTQDQLAELSDSSQRMIAHYESHIKRPPLDRVKALADALGITVDDLLGDSKPLKKKKNEDASYKIMKKVRIIERLPTRDQQAIFRLINSLAEKNKITEG